ncbi:MAG: asparaginase domain-containing protein [Sedimenticola sp.]|nr:asparaginase domain-containing protein [Sedimenticola sp.]
MKIKIYTTGGTIDKIYFDAKSEFQVGEPQISGLLKEANIAFDFEVESLLRKDSLEMTDADRRLIAQRLRDETTDRILLTHGTDTMVDTARELVGIEGKTIVLTGSMQPARLRVSDAIFNIGYAVAAVQLLPPGVYVAMNGQLFDPLHARKNVAEHRFEMI